jgi:glycosyltransferase involved in cell wall biosynthesis
VAVGKEVLEQGARLGAMRVSRSSVIYNGVDTAAFHPPGKKTLDRREETLGFCAKPVIGTVGRMVKGKGITTLLQAFVQFSRGCQNPHLLLVGDGEERQVFERSACNMGINERVHFTGDRADVVDIYPLLDLYVQPSYTEGISLTMLEASSCALPVVATRVGGNPEIVVDGKTGLLVPPRDPDALAEATLWMWENRERATAMGRAARQRVKEKFSLDRMVRDYLELYHELYERKTGVRKRPLRRKGM